MAKEAKVDYDAENDILYVYSGEKVKDSLEIDKFVIDFSADNKIVGVEIFDASSVISKLSGKKINGKNLSEIKEAEIEFYQGKELFYIVIFLEIQIQGTKQGINIQVPAPKSVMV